MLNLTSNKNITEYECSYRSLYFLWSRPFVLRERDIEQYLNLVSNLS